MVTIKFKIRYFLVHAYKKCFVVNETVEEVLTGTFSNFFEDAINGNDLSKAISYHNRNMQNIGVNTEKLGCFMLELKK